MTPPIFLSPLVLLASDFLNPQMHRKSLLIGRNTAVFRSSKFARIMALLTGNTPETRPLSISLISQHRILTPHCCHQLIDLTTRLAEIRKRLPDPLQTR